MTGSTLQTSLCITGSCLTFVIELFCNWLILRMWCHLGEFIRSALSLTLLCIHMHFIWTSVSAHFEVNNVKISLSQISFSFVLQKKMHYYRYENAEVSCCYKYLMFSYNIIFWVSWWQMFCFSKCMHNLTQTCPHLQIMYKCPPFQSDIR